MDIVSLVLLALALAAVLHWLHYNLTKTIPGPWGVPVLFNLLSLILHNEIRRDQFQWWNSLRQRYGRTFMVRVPGLGLYVISSHPDDVEYVLATRFENFDKAHWLGVILKELFGRGIFSVNGADWVLQRKAAANAFRVRDIKHSLDVFSRVADQTLAVLDGCVGKEIDVMTLMASVSLKGFTESAYSFNSGEVSFVKSEFAFHFDRFLAAFNTRTANPLYKWTPWARHERVIRESGAFLNSIATSVIAEARKRDASHKVDMLTPFLENPDLDDTYMRDVFISFLVAGRDTTSQTLSWALYHLAHHQDIQDRAAAEILERVGPDAEPDWKTHTDGALPYLTAVIKETLRASPPVPIDPKTCLSDDVLPGSGYKIPAGATFDWAQILQSLDEANFPNPHVFDPTRFLPDGKAPQTNRPPWVPFQYGPRICLGKRMAENTMEVVLIKCLRKFRFFPAKAHTPRPVTAITMTSFNGIVLRVERR